MPQWLELSTPETEFAIAVAAFATVRRAGGQIRAARRGAHRVQPVAIAPQRRLRNPEGRHVLIVLNYSRGRKTYNLLHQGKLVTSALNGNAVGTFVW